MGNHRGQVGVIHLGVVEEALVVLDDQGDHIVRQPGGSEDQYLETGVLYEIEKVRLTIEAKIMVVLLCWAMTFDRCLSSKETFDTSSSTNRFPLKVLVSRSWLLSVSFFSFASALMIPFQQVLFSFSPFSQPGKNSVVTNGHNGEGE